MHVDLLDALPTPFGLVRSGVAPDHPEVKSVQNDFEAVVSDGRVQFLGNVRVGTQLSVADLTSRYHAVVLAYGAASDRSLGIPGESLTNVCSARSFVAWYNGHPEFRDFQPNLECEDVVIIGQGNVAIDCARILCKTPGELRETDIAAHAADALSRSRVKRVHVLGRRGHVQAAFTMKELREVTKLEDAACVLRAEELQRGRTPASMAEIESARARKRMDALLNDTLAAASSGKSKQLILRFLLAPTRFVAEGSSTAVSAVECDVTQLSGPAEAQKATPTGVTERIPAGLVLKSIGYKSISVPGIPFDEKKAVVRNDKGRVVTEAGVQVPGVYVSGWLKRGPSGIIGTNIPDARETVACILTDKAEGKLVTPSVTASNPLDSLRALLREKGVAEEKLVTWDAYKKIDAAEVARGQSSGKPREKFTDVGDMLAAAAR